MLEAPATAHADKQVRRPAAQPRLRRDLSDDFARRSPPRGEEETAYVPRRRFGGLRFRIKGGVPRSLVGRVLAGGTILAMLGGFTAVLWGARSLLLHDSRLTIASSAAIETIGNSHLTRAQMLSVFGEDVDRNILEIPLAERRSELESLPWVEHAAVMRLLPNHLRVAIKERTPIAFVRHGSHVGLVDAQGVLLEMSPDVPADQHYSFPVVTGVTPGEPASTRAARMKLYQRFVSELDAGDLGSSNAEGSISRTLSEVDLSSPEDVIALIPAGSADILVHFGDDEFLARYQRFKKNIADWAREHPNLASVDMRYDREAVLEMKPGPALAASPVADGNASGAPAAPKTQKPAGVGKGTKPALKPAAKAAKKPGTATPGVATPGAATPVGAHLQTAFPVHPRPAGSAKTQEQGDPQ